MHGPSTLPELPCRRTLQGAPPETTPGGVINAMFELSERVINCNGDKSSDKSEESSVGNHLHAAINYVQGSDGSRLVRRFCFVKNLYFGDTTKIAAERVGASRHTR